MFESTWNRRRFLTALGGAAATASLPSQAFAAPLLLAADSTTTAPRKELGRKGDRWNESRTFADTVTGRAVRQLTSAGEINEKPTYHTNTGFTADGRFCIFATTRGGRGAMCRCDVESGEIVQLTDAIPGTGGWALCARFGESGKYDGTGISGKSTCLAPKSHWAVFFVGRSLHAVNLDSLAERVLVEDIGREWVEGNMSIDPTETYVIVPMIPSHPDVAAGRKQTKSYRAAFAKGGMRTRFLQVPLAGGPAKVAAEFDGAGCAHSPHCPTDPDLLLVDRDLPPNFWGGGDHGHTNRCWFLRLSTGALTPIVPRDEQRFQVHAAWTYDGQQVLYHGSRHKGGWYIGVADRQGHVVRQYDFPKASGYGHLAAMPGRPAMILDGNLSNDLLQWLYYDAEQPRVEPIARHATVWEDKVPTQCSHPHPQADPTGRWVLYQAAAGGRSNVFVVRV